MWYKHGDSKYSLTIAVMSLGAIIVLEDTISSIKSLKCYFLGWELLTSDIEMTSLTV